jgi:RNA polymerase sigma-70 factor (ECF subfamily)
MSQSSSSTELPNLVRRLRAGDAVALRALASRASDRLRTLGYQLYPNSSDLQCQEESAKAIENAALRLRRTLEAVSPGSLAIFFVLAGREMRRELLALARNVSGLRGVHAADANGRPSTSVGAPWARPLGMETTPEPQRRMRFIELHALIERLPAEDREVFDLLWYYQLDQENAAAALGITLATLKRRWMSARLQLLDLLSTPSHST